MGKRSSHAALAIRLAESAHTGFTAGEPGYLESEREQSYRRRVRPQSDGQQRLMGAIEHHNLTIALGPAGTGKTYLAVSAAVAALEAGEVGRIVLRDLRSRRAKASVTCPETSTTSSRPICVRSTMR